MSARIRFGNARREGRRTSRGDDAPEPFDGRAGGDRQPAGAGNPNGGEPLTNTEEPGHRTGPQWVTLGGSAWAAVDRARRTRLCRSREVAFVLIRPVRRPMSAGRCRRPIDGCGPSGLACRSLGPTRSTRREEATHAHRASGSSGGRRPSLGDCATGMGPTDGTTAAGGRSCCLRPCRGPDVSRREGRHRDPSSTSRTLRVKASGVNGFWRKGAPDSSTSRRTMGSSM